MDKIDFIKLKKSLYLKDTEENKQDNSQAGRKYNIHIR